MRARLRCRRLNPIERNDLRIFPARPSQSQMSVDRHRSDDARPQTRDTRSSPLPAPAPSGHQKRRSRIPTKSTPIIAIGMLIALPTVSSPGRHLEQRRGLIGAGTDQRGRPAKRHTQPRLGKRLVSNDLASSAHLPQTLATLAVSRASGRIWGHMKAWPQIRPLHFWCIKNIHVY